MKLRGDCRKVLIRAAHRFENCLSQITLQITRGGTPEFELRSIKFKMYISGLRSIFLFQKKHNFA